MIFQIFFLNYINKKAHYTVVALKMRFCYSDGHNNALEESFVSIKVIGTDDLVPIKLVERLVDKSKTT